MSELAGLEPEPTPPAEGDITPPAAPIDSIYGDLEVKFPEGMDETLREDPSLKGFVDRESGELNYSNILKSYVHTKKQVGMNKVVLPTEHSTAQELDEFYEKLGYKPNEEDYVVNKAEESKLSDDRISAIKTLARENRLPPAVAQKMVDMMEGQANTDITESTKAVTDSIAEGLEGLKTEWGQAYDQNLAVASRVLKEVVNDESVMAVFADPRVGSNPAVIKALSTIGQKLFAEDGFKGDSNDGALSPGDATVRINEIMGDTASPYWNKGHPSHKDVVNEVLKLHGMKQGR